MADVAVRYLPLAIPGRGTVREHFIRVLSVSSLEIGRDAL